MFSIIIPTCNRAGILERSLQAVSSLFGVERCEILVVNDGSVDDTAAVLEAAASRQSNLRALHKENGGPGEARNFGLERAGLERILFLDDDVFPEPDLLEAHSRALDRVCDVSQGDIIWHEEVAQDEIIRFMDARGMQFRLHGRPDGERLSCLQVYTANVAMRRRDAVRAGGFDRAFAARRYAFEDTAFALRLEKQGCRIAFSAGARARHLHPMTEEGLFKRERAVGYGMAVARTRYPEIADALGFDRITRFASGQLALTKLAEALGLPKLLPGLLERNARRRLGLRRAFLEGALEAMRETGGGAA